MPKFKKHFAKTRNLQLEAIPDDVSAGDLYRVFDSLVHSVGPAFVFKEKGIQGAVVATTRRTSVKLGLAEPLFENQKVSVVVQGKGQRREALFDAPVVL